MARRRLDDDGQVRADLLGDALARSWQRCLVGGLDARAAAAPHASSARHAQAVARAEALVRHAAPVLEAMRPQAEALGAVLLLADASGTLLQSVGDDGFATRAQRVALRPGACWSEPLRGTNAIGTALVEQRPTVVLGAEHYLARNAFLGCIAAPVFDPTGRLAGVLDLSGDRRRMSAASLPALQALVCQGAAQVARTWFEAAHAMDLRVRLHRSRAGLWSPAHAALAFDEAGRWCAAEDIAREALAPRPGVDAAALLGVGTEELHAWAHDAQPREIELPGLGRWWLRVDPAQRRMPTVAVAVEPGPREQRAVLVGARARLDDRGYVLLRALPDPQLRSFVQTLHEIGPRRDGPWREVASDRWTTAASAMQGLQDMQGGTLLLTGVEALPLPAQAVLLTALDAAACDLVLTHASPLGGPVLAGRFLTDLHTRLSAQALQ